MELEDLERALRSEIDPVFFESRKDFRPLAHVIKVLSTEVTSSVDDVGRGRGRTGSDPDGTVTL